MGRKSKQARAREFTRSAREEIYLRDNCTCIFCAAGYRMENAEPFALAVRSVMHYIPRSKNGLGVPRNGAVGCQYHHDMMDNGKEGHRKEMLGIFREYLRQQYPDWDEDRLVYRKYAASAAGVMKREAVPAGWK